MMTPDKQADPLRASVESLGSKTMGRTGQLGPKAQSILQSAGVCGDARLHSSMQPLRRHSVKFRPRPCVSSQTCLSAEFARTELNAQRRAMRLAAKPQPEVHIIGEICGGTGFGEGTSVCCKWALEAGDRWELLEGAKGGQTQTDTPESGTDVLVWSHPIDAHFVAGSMQGWPRLLFQCWRLDSYGRLEVEGYGFVHIPSSPGIHEVTCPTWRPVGTAAQEWASFFIGGTPSLKTTSVLYTAASERYRLVTASSGSVHVRVEVMHRHMDLYGVEA